MRLHPENVPNYIIDSQNRCELRGMDRYAIPQQQNIIEEQLNEALIDYKKLFDVYDALVHQLFQLVEGIPFVLLVTDDECTLLEVKGEASIKRVIECMGIRPGAKFIEEVVGTNSIALSLRLNEPIQVVGSHHYQPYLHTIACYSVPFQFDANGTKKGTISIATLVDYQSPLLLSMLNSVVNSIEREIQLKDFNKRLNILNQVIIESSKNGIIELDKSGKITEINTIAQTMTGWEKEISINNSTQLGSYLNEIREGNDITDVEVWITNEKTGQNTVALLDGIPIRNEYDQVIGAFGHMKDVTNRYQVKERYNYLAFHDELTGLANRRSFQQTLVENLANLIFKDGSLAIFLLDLDRFKFINDTLGHEKGDWLLIEVGNRLKEFLPDNASLFRMGGDEFTIVFKDFQNEDEVRILAEGIIDLFHNSFTIESYEFHMSTSIGVAIYQNEGDQPIPLFQRADTAMYRAKEMGKNTFVIYDANMEHSYFKKFTFEQELRNAIEEKHLELYYQPQVSLCSQEIIGLEALLRWNHPTFGLISPDEFIPLAEELGIATLIGDYVLQKACHQLKDWKEQGYRPIKISINLSPQDFLSHTIVEKVKKRLTESDIDPQYLELEITESMAMDVKNATEMMKELNQIGVQIAMDDFGKGYSSLNYLKNFQIHRLKIDRSFIDDILIEQNDVKIISAIIHLAHSLNLKVIAEGVETKEQADFLFNLHCDEAQGYYYGKPLPVGDIEGILTKY